MRFVPTNCIRPGMINGKNIFGRHGEFLLSRGTAIQEAYIEKIKELGLSGIYVEDELSDDIEITEVISENLRHKAVNTIKKTFGNLEKGMEITDDKVQSMNFLVKDIVNELLKSKDMVVNMNDLRVFDDYTFYHSVNVAVLSIIMGVSLNLDKDSLFKLGLAAILHDIGKVFIPKEILNKNVDLTEDEFQLIKSHSAKGYEYLRDNYQIPSITYIGILQHHEKFNGRGYPLNLKEESISLFGRIIALADVYDALTSKRSYRDPMSPSEAIEYIMGNGGVHFDPRLVAIFIKKVAPYPVGTCVLLSNNNTGILLENHMEYSLRPKIRVFRHDNNDVEPYAIDLLYDKDTLGITIIGIVNDIVVPDTITQG